MKAWIGAAAAVIISATSGGAQAAQETPWRKAEVMALAEKVADHQIAMLAGGVMPANGALGTSQKTGWVQGALFVGLTEMADHSDKPIYKQTILHRGAANDWKLGPAFYHADDHVIGQSYLWASRNGAGPEAYAHVKDRLDGILAHPPQVDLVHLEYTDPRGVHCSQRWCWSDALFMAPPLWLELSQITGDTKYADYAKAEFIATTDYLYDPVEHLYYRDSRFFERRGPDGEKVFWSRGNGWVFAGLARMIPLLPENDPVRKRMETVFIEMAGTLKAIQKPDGFWAPSLLARNSVPESSGTGFFVYGLAWGIKAGLLEQEDYEPVVRKGWKALVASVHPDGFFGNVQAISDQPDNVSYEDTQFYGVGAFLLAATAVSELDLSPQ